MKKIRCAWCEGSDIYKKYHDSEWGVPVYEDSKLFECLILETFQSGLSWITILKKRENFRSAFDNFDYDKIATYKELKYEELLQNPGIIRHKLKIKGAITNAQMFIEIQKEFGSFSKFIWGFKDDHVKPIFYTSLHEVPSKTTLSEIISKDLKKRGFKFVGPTVIYAFMQAIGMVNDHLKDCFRHEEINNIVK